jgi:hypothetical protein
LGGESRFVLSLLIPWVRARLGMISANRPAAATFQVVDLLLGLCVCVTGMQWGADVPFACLSWHTCLPDVFEKARPLLEASRHSRQCAAEWKGAQWLDDGLFLPWKKVGPYRSGYSFFERLCGDLAPSHGNTAEWRVVGHAAGYDAAAAGSMGITKKAPVKETDGELAEASSHEGAQAPTSPAVTHRLCACPALKLMQPAKVLKDTFARYELGETVGEGTFGDVRRGRIGDQTLVVKVPGRQSIHIHWVWTARNTPQSTKNRGFRPTENPQKLDFLNTDPTFKPGIGTGIAGNPPYFILRFGG